MLPLNSVQNWRVDDICPYDLAQIVFVGHDVYDVPILLKNTVCRKRHTLQEGF